MASTVIDLKRLENSITLAFAVGRHIAHEQIVEAVESNSGQWIHHVFIKNECDLNDDVCKWLLEAYNLAKVENQAIKKDYKKNRRID